MVPEHMNFRAFELVDGHGSVTLHSFVRVRIVLSPSLESCLIRCLVSPHRSVTVHYRLTGRRRLDRGTPSELCINR